MKHVKLFEDFLSEEATTSWSKMMKGVKAGDSGPWSLVAIENKKVVAQKIDIRDKNILPAHFEAMRKEHPKAKIHIEDAGGQVVWNEAFINEGKDFKQLAFDILSDLANEFDPWEIGDMLLADAEDTVDGYYPKWSSADKKKLAKEILHYANQPNEWANESIVAEAKKTITVTLYGGKEIQYTDAEIQELIDDLDLGADDLPKWIYVASLHDKSFPKKKEAILDLLKKIKDAKKSVSINVASDKPFQNEIVFEEFINEAKELDRDAFIALLKDKYKFTFVRTTEDFDGSKGGVWTSGESSPSLGGKKIYNYYGSGAAYELGVLKKFEDTINKLGWYSEWYDAGTMMIWPN